MRANRLRGLWQSGGTAVNGWLAIPNSFSTEIMAHQGWDSLTVDMQHGVVDYQAMVNMLTAISTTKVIPLARVPWNEPGIIGKMLDAGIEGVIVPMVNSADEAQAVVRAGRYPPLGSRSFGPVIAGMRRQNHFDWSTDGIAVIPMIETAEAVTHLDEILAVPGIDAVYVGPADLSISLGLPPGNNDGRSEFDDALTTIVAGCRKAGVVPGIHASAALVERRLEQGFRMITVTSDMLALRASLAADLATARGAKPATGDAGAIY